MTQPRNDDGSFKDVKVVESEHEITFYVTEYQCRIIGNRLQRASKRYNKLHNSTKCDLHQDCSHWADKFQSKANTRKNSDEKYDPDNNKRHTKENEKVRITLTDYECWSLGMRLFEVGEWFGEKGYDEIEQETKWLARMFHSEKKQQTEDNND